MRSSYELFLKNIVCAEVGVSRAENAINMMGTLPLAHFYLIDNYDVNNSTFQYGKVFTPEEREEFIADVRKRLEPFSGRCTLLVEDSHAASKQFSDAFFDYVYIDAQHDEANVLIDLISWYPKVKPGGIIAGHDAGVPGVQKALGIFFDGRFNIGGAGEVRYASEDWWTVRA